MLNSSCPRVAIVDYSLGNLFSVKQACLTAGMEATVTSSWEEMERSDAVVLPGVGAFGDAMKALHQLGLAQPLKEAAANGKPLVGICLGMQLLMSESWEFGRHPGLGIVPGEVVRLENSVENGRKIKVPQVGWNRIRKAAADLWADSPLGGLPDGDFMYFVHSFYCKPADPALILTKTTAGRVTFCSSLLRGNLFACQFHPERSGPSGLQIYRNIASWIERLKTGGPVCRNR